MAKRSTERVLRDEIAAAEKEVERAFASLTLRKREVESALDARRKADERLSESNASLVRARLSLEAYLPLPVALGPDAEELRLEAPAPVDQADEPAAPVELEARRKKTSP